MKTKACLACTITNHYLMTLASGFYNSGQVFTFHFPTDHLRTPQFFKKRTLHSSALSNSLELDSTELAKSNKYLQHQSQDLAQYFFVHWWWYWQYPGYCAKVGHWSAYHSESLQSAVNTWINCHETRINHKSFLLFESGILRIQLKESGILFTIWIRNPVLGVQNPRRRIQNRRLS